MRNVLLLLVLGLPLCLLAQPNRMDISLEVAPGDTNKFWLQIPENYRASSPPPILVWWHGLGGTQHEIRDSTTYRDVCNSRGWILTSHLGPNDRHWNARVAQNHVRTMLDWVRVNYPFCMDSIYMAGSSMGGAGGQVWNDNNCGLSDYMIAATLGASMIIDCQLRQEQYLANNDTNRAMRAAFGGVPGDPNEDAILFEYHRYSAVHLADTSQSMHFNSLNLPVYTTWGSTVAEWLAYGTPALRWDSLRTSGHADTTLCDSCATANHAYWIMLPDSEVRWLSGFSLNRFPEEISINADESDEYYWTRVVLANSEHTFGRYGVERNYAGRRLDINLVRNIQSLDVEFQFPWASFDSLVGHWENFDRVAIPQVTIRLIGVPPVISAWRNGIAHPFTWARDTLAVAITQPGDFRIVFQPQHATFDPDLMPQSLRIVSIFPNPFNPTTTISFSLAKAGDVEIGIYDVLGRNVSGNAGDHMGSPLQAGEHRVTFDGSHLTSGIYFVRVRSAELSNTLKIVLLK